MNEMQKHINEILDKAKKYNDNKENVIGAFVLVVRGDDTYLTNYCEAEISNEENFKMLKHIDWCLQKIQKDFKDVLSGKAREVDGEWA